MVHRAQRRIWAEHTYARRIDSVLLAVGLDQYRSPTPSISVLVSSNRPTQVEHVLRMFAAQRGVDAELLLLGHGFEIPDSASDLAGDLGIANFRTLHAPSHASLGSCLNQLVAAADGDLVAKMDDDDLYGPHYLHDQLNALDYSGADVVGKQAHHMYLEAQGLTIVRFPEREHRFTDLVMGPTIMTGRTLALAYPFQDVSRGEDTAFLGDVVADGLSVYSCDRFNFVQVRSAQSSHTWEASSAELLANGRVLAFGTNPQHINI
jgi:hypothetical protein